MEALDTDPTAGIGAVGLMAAMPALGAACPRKYRPIVDTHRHPVGPMLAARMAKRGLYDPTKSFPQTNPLDFVCYRDFVDLDYAMAKQRKGSVTLSIASNGGEVEWIAHDLLQVSTGDALKFLNDEYLVIRIAFPATSH